MGCVSSTKKSDDPNWIKYNKLREKIELNPGTVSKDEKKEIASFFWTLSLEKIERLYDSKKKMKPQNRSKMDQVEFDIMRLILNLRENFISEVEYEKYFE